MNMKKVAVGILAAVIIAIILSIYFSITAEPEEQQQITTPSQFETDEVNVNPDK